MAMHTLSSFTTDGRITGIAERNQCASDRVIGQGTLLASRRRETQRITEGRPGFLPPALSFFHDTYSCCASQQRAAARPPILLDPQQSRCRFVGVHHAGFDPLEDSARGDAAEERHFIQRHRHGPATAVPAPLQSVRMPASSGDRTRALQPSSRFALYRLRLPVGVRRRVMAQRPRIYTAPARHGVRSRGCLPFRFASQIWSSTSAH